MIMHRRMGLFSDVCHVCDVNHMCAQTNIRQRKEGLGKKERS